MQWAKKYLLGSILLSLMVVFWTNCSGDDEEMMKKSAPGGPTPLSIDFGYLDAPDLPSDNPLTEEGVLLGRMLFYDPILSKDGTLACAGCHKQEFAFSDPNQFSLGVGGQMGKRQSMTLFNLARHQNGFFWDGRAKRVREQVLEPIQSSFEMNETLENVVAKLSQSKQYRAQFNCAFGSDTVTSEKIALALEQFLLTIISQDSKFDRVSQDLEQLTESEERGRSLYFRRFDKSDAQRSGAHCFHCHGDSNLDDNEFMDIGLDPDGNIVDLGRGAVTGGQTEVGKFKVPSLRNIAVSAPYMHDGRFQTLEEVLDFYNEEVHGSANLESTLKPVVIQGLGLTEENKKDLINFLHTLTDQSFLQNEAFGSPFKN